MDNETKQMLEMIMKKLDRIDEKQTNMETDINNIKARQDEIFFVVKAIEHSNTIGKAEIDNLTFKVAHNEGIINKIGDVIVEERAVK